MNLNRAFSWLPILALSVGGASSARGQTAFDLNKTLKGIEERYNQAKTLQVNFTEAYTFQKRKRTESGTLFLRKPGRMRWVYTQPEGKLFVSDGEFVYYYNPEEKRAEKSKLKETEDMRAPLAFLLGRLNFKDDFREFRSSPRQSPAEGSVYITATPKSDKLPYTEVSFLVTPDSTIRQLEVKGQDNSVLDFTFEAEKRNPLLADSLFKFAPPPGVPLVDSSK